MKGYRTLILGFLMAVVPPALSYLAGLDWTAMVGPNAAMVIAGVITMMMRLVTTTPPGTNGTTGTNQPPAQ